MNKVLPCDENKCERPLIFPDNLEAMSVWNLCQNQLIISGMGDVIGVRIEAVKAAMEIQGIDEEEKQGCLEKILAYSAELFRKDL
jgi:hypothetical protein